MGDIKVADGTMGDGIWATENWATEKLGDGKLGESNVEGLDPTSRGVEVWRNNGVRNIC